MHNICSCVRARPQLVVFYGVLFFVPPILMIAWNGGKLSMTREEFLQTETARRRV